MCECVSVSVCEHVCVMVSLSVCLCERVCVWQWSQLQCHTQTNHSLLQHSVQCGGGTGIYLLVNSSIVVVLRGPRATLWGSVYLDQHGEEDRDLK